MSGSAEPLRLRMTAAQRVAAGTLVVRGTPRRREALRVRLIDEHGNVGSGEAMPLPGYSRDDADAAERALQSIAARVARSGLIVPASPTHCAPPQAAAWLDATLAPHADVLAVSTAARFALECALVDLLSRRAGIAAARWLGDGRAPRRVPVSLLLPDDDRAAVAAAARAVAAGFTVLKLKIARPGRSDADEDAFLGALRDAADAARPAGAPRALLRLDANGAIDAARTAERVAALARHGVELVEEPASGAALLSLSPLALPWAADESLADPELAAALLALPHDRRPAAWVLKPAQLGLAACLRMAAAAAAQKLGVIVTHSLDGDIGHAAACALAGALPRPPRACGLAPHAGLDAPGDARPWLEPPAAPGLGLAAQRMPR